MAKTYAIVGGWGFPHEQHAVGMTSAAFSPDTGKLKILSHAFPEVNCGAACVDQKKAVVYCVNERPVTNSGEQGGEVYAVRLNKENGDLTEINHTSSFGAMPCYCEPDHSGKYLVVTNHGQRNSILKTIVDADGHFSLVREYDETSVILFRLREDGGIGEPCDIVRHQGHGILPNQVNAHAHSVVCAPKDNLLIVCDKGNDSIYSYSIDYHIERLVLRDHVEVFPGSSPRYSTFHPHLPVFYYNCETKPMIGIVRYDASGKLNMIGNVSCLPEGTFTEKGMQSDLCIDSEGKYLYDLVRDTNQIIVYAIHPQTGLLQMKQALSCVSAGRGVSISPDGKYLYVAAHPHTAVIAYRICEDGTLTEEETAAEIVAGNITFASIA